jgi:predicted DsbA family dithiol-disulfide isomerase
LTIEFVSDVACPWCAVGVHSLESALEQVRDDLGPIAIQFQPFELNPDMPPEGADTMQYLSAKFGIDETRIRAGQAAIRERGAAVGLAFGERARVWNTFDAHRLLYWAAREGQPSAQRELKKALLSAYHGEGRNVSDHDVLVEVANAVGLDATRARQILACDEFAADVRTLERRWREAGINSVPAVVVDHRHLIVGAQPPDVFAQALRHIAGHL